LLRRTFTIEYHTSVSQGHTHLERYSLSEPVYGKENEGRCKSSSSGLGNRRARRKLLVLLADPSIAILVVEHKDRLACFGFRYIETLLAVQDW